MPKSKFSYLLLLFFSICIYSSTSFASFQKDLWFIWQVNNPLNKAVIQHDDWAKFLKRNLIINDENIALLNYKKIPLEDIQLLNRYIKHLSGVPISLYNRDEQLAYWINLYNALTVKIILEYLPVSSIRDVNISPGLFSIGPWGKNLVEVNGIEISMEEIENRIVRPIWNDPRTLYTLNNGSIGAPNLFYEPFIGTRLEQQLNQAATTYINSLRGVQVIENRLILSKIYEWFEEDFGGSNKIVQHLMIYADKPLQNQLKNVIKINRYIYNWHLNCPGIE